MWKHCFFKRETQQACLVEIIIIFEMIWDVYCEWCVGTMGVSTVNKMPLITIYWWRLFNYVFKKILHLSRFYGSQLVHENFMYNELLYFVIRAFIKCKLIFFLGHVDFRQNKACTNSKESISKKHDLRSVLIKKFLMNKP